MSSSSNIKGDFIFPDRSLEDMQNPNDKIGMEIFSGYKAIDQVGPFLGKTVFSMALLLRYGRLTFHMRISAQPNITSISWTPFAMPMVK